MAERLAEATPDRFFLCGLSMGGCVALEVMRIATERVTDLVLMATSAKPDAEQTARRRRLVKLAHDKGIAAVADILSDRLLGPNGRTDLELRRRIVMMAEAIGADSFARQQEAIIGRRDQTSLLPHIGVQRRSWPGRMMRSFRRSAPAKWPMPCRPARLISSTASVTW
ncbi:alpha/beta hydrolase [Aurantimonas marina]|uniref:hypothetical protein n=1 Tax=Aurantimonas marina TaxID=2780508 RepID=UPI0019D0B648|nr:hypothetical protein [Aurantimonas marina]